MKDAQQLITKVLQSKAFVKKDAKGAVVGTVGGSYGGGIQAQPRRDRRARSARSPRAAPGTPCSTPSTPTTTSSPATRPASPTTLNQQGVFKQKWTSLFFASGNGNPVGGVPPTGTPAGTCPQDKLVSGEPTTVAELACPGFTLAVCQTYADLSSTGDAADADRALVARRARPTTQIAKLTRPDPAGPGPERHPVQRQRRRLDLHRRCGGRARPVQMIWNSGGHGGYDSLPGECEVYGGGTGGADSRASTTAT